MSQDEEYYYSNDGGMVSDSATRRPKSSKTKIPKFKRITRRVPHTEFGEMMGGLTLGMLFVGLNRMTPAQYGSHRLAV
ncbi:hypothetical protein [Peribacillus simplex]|uniref:hypothetical protein n=1 Tax=Peribacillus simplex TaxID=1478 RepID=UPI003D2A631B